MMKICQLVCVLSVISFFNSCTTGPKSSKESRSPSFTGPFSIEKTMIQSFTYDFEYKVEDAAGKSSADLAAGSPDGTITLRNAVQVSVNKIDPYTSLPATDAYGQPVTEIKNFAAGAILNPGYNPAENIIIPKGVTITYKKISSDQLISGRFAYYGTAPRFDSENLEMTASKMGHSLRVKAWVTDNLVKNYEWSLLTRFKGFYDAFSTPTMHFVKLKSAKNLAQTQYSADSKKWYQVVSFYENTLLEKSGLDVYNAYADDVAYRDSILTAMIRVFLNNNSLTVQDGLNLYNQYKNDSNFINSRQAVSTELFKTHLGERFTVTLPDANKSDRVGYLTFVYPIAIDKDGPFKLPAPGLRKFPLNVSMESRWWSNRWVDEFGGFPFLQITPDGVAFHGPISLVNSEGVDTWFLKRANVSHSCMRMDASDLLELRALIPKNMNELQGKGKTIPLIIQEWPDVTDIDNDGKFEVVDVAYYKIPEYLGQASTVANWQPKIMNKSYWTEMFKPYVNQLPSKNTFQVVSTPTSNKAVFTGLPKYKIVNDQTVIDGYYGETPMMTMPQRPTAIIQYREDGVTIKTSANQNDNLGKFPPSYFNRL